ncbi:MAG: sugar ABC transporter permease [Firmicutes bacterium]|nr:sugar ABC transporter permease [Bacillota bacterium]
MPAEPTPPVAALPPAVRRGSAFTRLFQGDRGVVLAFLLPSLLLLVAVVLLPLAYALLLSLEGAQVTVVGGHGSVSGSFVGLANYAALFANPGFWQALRTTLYYWLVSILIEVVFGIGAAVLLNRRFRGQTVVRALVFLPWAIPTVVNANLWSMILDGDPFGGLNALLMQLHLTTAPVVWLNPSPVLAQVAWLSHALTAVGASLGMNWIIVGDEWHTLPIVIFLTLAGLQSIPHEYYESARIDGAGPWATFRHVTWPLLGPVLAVVLILRTMQLLRAFTLIYTLESTGLPVLSITAYQYAFTFGAFGQGSAVAFLIGVLALLIAFFYIRVLFRTEFVA